MKTALWFVERIEGGFFGDEQRRGRVAEMSDEGGFRTGQPVWVIDSDDSQRPAEYIGEGSAGGAGAEHKAFVIYVDRTGSDVVDLERVVPREPPRPALEPSKMRSPASLAATGGDDFSGGRGGSAGRAAAAHAYERRQTAVTRQAELAEVLEHPADRAREAGTRAEDAARAAGAAQTRAAEAAERSAEAHENAARVHERVAELEEKRGHGSAAAEHRKHAADARKAARRASRAAARCRQTD